MKYHHLIALAATVTGTAFAAMPATLPEFKSSKQLADWRAEKAAEASVKSATDDHAFYTGKPYVDASGGYAFKFRSYANMRGIDGTNPASSLLGLGLSPTDPGTVLPQMGTQTKTTLLE